MYKVATGYYIKMFTLNMSHLRKLNNNHLVLTLKSLRNTIHLPKQSYASDSPPEISFLPDALTSLLPRLPEAITY